MTKQELIDKIENLVIEYFETHTESVSEVYTISGNGIPSIELNYDFNLA